MKTMILDFFFKDFWVKFILILMCTILSLFTWEGWVFVLLFVYFLAWMIYNVNKSKKTLK